MVDVNLERLEAARIVLQILRPLAPLGLAQEVAAGAVRVERDLVAEVAAQQLADRLSQDLAGQIPQRDIDAAEDAHLTPTLRIGIEHIVQVY